MKLRIFLFISLLLVVAVSVCDAAPHVSRPHHLQNRNTTHRPFLPGAPSDDINVWMDEEALMLSFDVDQGEARYIIENEVENYVIAEYVCGSTSTLCLPLTMLQQQCVIVVSTESENSYIIFVNY